MIEWTAEKIAEKSIEEVKSLRDNAARLGSQAIFDLCEAELARRKPTRIKRAPKNLDESREGYYVSEFHFVCVNEQGVTRNQDGSIWTGTWVVAAAHGEAALKHGALVALHSTKAESSYLQGTIIGWKRMPREIKYTEDQYVKTELGIDFLFTPSTVPLEWKGVGSGEKGYAWTAIPPDRPIS
jgi:hypothetical protein